MLGLSCSSASRSLRAKAVLLSLILLIFLTPMVSAQRTELKPGWNIFSPEQDVELGRKVAEDAERKLPMLNDRRVDDYLNRIGRRLAEKAPGERFPYSFKAVNDSSINAFALPGGFLYIHRGVIEAAENEAQLMGVIGHEIGHAALRHGTNQATKAYIAQAPLAILGGVLGNSVGSAIAMFGAQFTASSVLLKYSRDAERQADIVGTQVLYDTNYDPRAMAQFFEKLEAESKGNRPPEWFSSHPSPENRMQNAMEEVRRLGGPPSGYSTDSREFQEIQRYVRSLPAPRTAPGTSARRKESGRIERPAAPSNRHQSYENNFIRLRHPDNWKVYSQGSAVTLAPDGGIVDTGRDELAYGMMVSMFDARRDRQGRVTLEKATDQLIDSLHDSNPRMKIIRDHERARVDGEPALATLLSNDSAIGGKERILIVSVLQRDGLLYFVGVAPEEEYERYRRTFGDVIDSVRLKNR